MSDPLVDLTSLGDAATHLANVSLTVPSNLDELITAVSGVLQSYASRRFPAQSYSVVLNGEGGDRLCLPNTPITAVASVQIDGLAIPAAATPVAPGYVFSSSQVLLRGYRFCDGVQNVAISYTAGFAQIPAELGHAALEALGAVVATFQYADPRAIELQAGGTKLVFASGKSTELTDLCLTPNVTQILNQYRRMAPI